MNIGLLIGTYAVVAVAAGSLTYFRHWRSKQKKNEWLFYLLFGNVDFILLHIYCHKINLMLLKACRNLGKMLNTSKQGYTVTPQLMKPLSAEFLLDHSEKTTKRTKSICTIGYFSQHKDLKLNNQKTQENLSIRDSVLLASIFPMATIQSIWDKW